MRTISTHSMNPDGLGKSDTSLRTGMVEPIVSIIENKQRARQTPQKMDEGQREGDPEILLTFMGFSKQSMETVELLFCFCFCFVLFSPYYIEMRVLSLFLANLLIY